MIKCLIVNGGSFRRHRFDRASSRLFKSSSSAERIPKLSHIMRRDSPDEAHPSIL
jgi:hypothetical protein